MLTRDGGKPNVKSLPYSAPQGPTNQMRQGPGLGGSNSDCGTQGEHSTNATSSGSPGLHGDNKGKAGSQR